MPASTIVSYPWKHSQTPQLMSNPTYPWYQRFPYTLQKLWANVQKHLLITRRSRSQQNQNKHALRLRPPQLLHIQWCCSADYNFLQWNWPPIKRKWPKQHRLIWHESKHWWYICECTICIWEAWRSIAVRLRKVVDYSTSQSNHTPMLNDVPAVLHTCYSEAHWDHS